METTTQADARHMAHALRLGRRGLGRVWPNPSVGCVVVRDGRVIGRGRTADGGRPHAEPQALDQAGDARGATVYVTLEPCAHHGNTPPCADALIRAGVARVVIGTLDPDPRTAGRGAARLREAGIAVDVGVCEAEARADLAGFLSRMQRRRPIVTLKLATSFDGRIATASGESRWITGPEARRYVHGLRASHDAVMVGGGTARADDPLLTVRGLGAIPQPVRVVLSSRLDLPAGALAQSVDVSPVWLVHGPGAAAPWPGAELIEAPTTGRDLNLPAVLSALADRGVTRVFCEGGATLAASLLHHGLVDRLITMTAGIGIGAEGTPGLGAMGLDRLADAPRFTLDHIRQLGPDVMAHWRHQ